MINSGWSYHIQPYKSEIITSWITRNAFAHGLCPYRFCKQVFESREFWYLDVDRNIPQTQLNLVISASKLSRQTVVDMTFKKWHNTLAYSKKSLAITPFILAVGIAGTNRYLFGQQFCPVCLREEPAFKKQWRLAYHTYCEVHRCQLHDCCPRCNSPIIPHKALNHNIINCYFCGMDLSMAEAFDLDNNDVKWFQCQFNKVLHEIQPVLMMGIANQSECIRYLRQLISFLSHRYYFSKVSSQLYGQTYKVQPRCQLERASIGARLKVLSILAKLLSLGNNNMMSCLGKAGLTQMFFDYSYSDPAITNMISLLRKSSTRKERVKLICNSIERKRFKEPARYREQRAKAILDRLKSAE